MDQGFTTEARIHRETPIWGNDFIDIRIYVLYNKIVNSFQVILSDVRRLLRRKRLVFMDAEAYDTLCRIAEREQHSPQEVALRLFTQVMREQDAQSEAQRSWEQLSPRQKQIAAHVCRGGTTRQIAVTLSISQTTVKSHVEAVMRKFNVNSREALRQLLFDWDLRPYL